MNIDLYQKYFPKTQLKPEVVWAAKYLESRGYEFGVDFGTSNAVKKSTDLVLGDLSADEKRGYGV